MAAPVTITFLGGLGEIGRNCAALECEGRIVLLDCGQLFPDDLPGVDAVLPDFTWLLARADRLAACLDATPVACVRLGLATRDEDRISRAADALREVTIARDVALVIDSHARLVTRLGLDGVHLTAGARSVRATRKELGEDAIVGAFCGNSRHDGMTAGELGADYISFGPAGATDADLDGEQLGGFWVNHCTERKGHTQQVA